MEKLAVLFPGAGYSLDAPLLYYGDFLFETRGYRRLPVNYQQPWESRLAQLAARSDSTVFLSKSIGTVQAGIAAAKLGMSPLQIFLTPVPETIPYIEPDSHVVIGTADPAFETISSHCSQCKAKTLYIDGADHSLEISGDPFASLEVLRSVIRYIDRALE